jgi:hypothetical protein
VSTSARTFVPQVVERAFAHEAPGSSSAVDFVIAFKRSRQKLADAISPIVGDSGFDAMFARAVRKTRLTEPLVEDFVATEELPHLEQLWTSLEQRDPATVRRIAVGTLTGFLEFLTTMIGEELVLRLLQNAWPEAVTGIGLAEKS